MRILSVHNRYLQRGGEDQSREAEEQLLIEHGHEVIRLEESNERVTQLGPLRTAARTVWSRESHARADALIRAHRPDVMHVQNFFPLISPSVYYAAHAHRVPVVQSLRNYRLLCLNAYLLRDDQPCELCLGRSVAWPGVRYRCYRGSRAASAVVAAMDSTHNLLRTWTRRVTRFIALTGFTRQKYIEGGFPADRIVVKPNFLSEDPGAGVGERSGAVFVGRLSPEKGLRTLLEAWQVIRTAEPLRIIGDGPDRGMVEEWAAKYSKVDYLGKRSIAEVYDAMKRSKVLVFPSLWYETFGRTIVEAFATGTPVVASRIGAAAELVNDGETGWLFTPGGVDDLARILGATLGNAKALNRAGRAARTTYETRYTAALNYNALLNIYESAIGACGIHS